MFKHIKINPLLLGNDWTTITDNLNQTMKRNGLSFNERELVFARLGFIWDTDWLFIVLNEFFTIEIPPTMENPLN